MFDRFCPEWFEEWFSRKFPPEAEPYAPLYIAERLRVDKNVIYRALLYRELEGIKPSPGRWVIPREALRRWLLERYSLNLPED